MRTAVVSDLHLGARSSNDVLGRAETRRRLIDALAGVERVVLLGDVLELRERELDEVVDLAAPFFEELGEALDGAEILLVPGNHDHALAGAVVAAADGPAGLGLETRLRPDAAHPLGRVAKRMERCKLELAYPGAWLGDGVYATHGHYLDVHSSVPTFENVALAAAARMVGEVPAAGAVPADYERVVAPVYRAAAGLGQLPRPGGAAIGADLSVRVWERLTGNGGGGADRLPVKLFESTFPGAVAAMNRLGLGPFAPDLSGVALHRSGLRGMAEVARRLGLEADVVVFGHTHRAGPLAGEEDGWTIDGGARLVNTGTWMYEPMLVDGPAGRSPYWPGTCLVLDGREETRLEHLLSDASHEDLRGPTA